MFDAVRDVSLRTIILVAVIVWSILGAIWFLSLGSGSAAQTSSPRASASTPEPAVAENPETARDTASSQGPAPTITTSDQDVVVSTGTEDEKEGPSRIPTSKDGFALQVGAFRSVDGARTLLRKIDSEGFPVFLKSAQPEDPLYRVMVGPFSTRDAAEARRKSLKVRGIESFVKELE